MHSVRAFSLVEMMVTLTLLVLMAALLLPSWRAPWENTNNEVLQSQVLDAIHLASQEATATRRPIVLSHESNQFIIYTDEYSDGSLRSKTQIITTIQLQLAEGKLQTRFYPNHSPYLKFFPAGTMRNYNGTFWYCNKSQTSPTWAIALGYMGRARVVYPNRSSAIKDNNGVEILCDS